MAQNNPKIEQAYAPCLNACQTSKDKALSAIMEQAYIKLEAECVDRVCQELCNPHGRIQDLDRFLGDLKNTVFPKYLSFSNIQ